MKLRSLLFIGLAFLIMFGVFPGIAVTLNNKYALPVYDYGALKFLGAILVLSALTVISHCVYVLFIKVGQDLPIPPVRATEQFVVEGLYRFTRNPMYLAYFAMILAEFLLFGHVLILAWLALVILFAHLGVVLLEEKNLREKFGQEYREYTEQVPRWFPVRPQSRGEKWRDARSRPT